MKIVRIVLLVFTVSVIAVVALGQAPRLDPDGIVPGDPLIYVEAHDLKALFDRYESSGLRKSYDSSPVHLRFETSRLGGRIKAKVERFKAVAGVEPVDLVREVGVGRTALAVYDVGALRLLIIAERPEGTTNGPLLNAILAGASSRTAHGVEYKVKEDAVGKAVAAVADCNGLLVVATDPVLAEEAIGRIRGEIPPNDVVTARRTRAAGSSFLSGDITAVIDMNRLRRDHYYRRYWLTGAGSESDSAQELVLDFKFGQKKSTERRYWSPTPTRVIAPIPDLKAPNTVEAWDAGASERTACAAAIGRFLFGNDSASVACLTGPLSELLPIGSVGFGRASNLQFDRGLPRLNRAVVLQASIDSALLEALVSAALETATGAPVRRESGSLVSACGEAWAVRVTSGRAFIGTPPDLVKTLEASEARGTSVNNSETLVSIRSFNLKRLNDRYNHLFKFLAGTSASGVRSEDENEDASSSTTGGRAVTAPNWSDDKAAAFFKDSVGGLLTLFPARRIDAESRQTADGRLEETVIYLPR